jgi:hypothetical protein
MKNDFNIHQWQAKFLTKLVKENRQVKEITSDGLARLDGMIEQPLLRNFLETFSEIHSDLLQHGEEFSSMDLIEFLSQEMQHHARDTGMDKL